MSWWLAEPFGIGSTCVAAGSLPLSFGAVDPSVVARTIFVGSVFFTSAGYLSVHETVSAPHGILTALADRACALWFTGDRTGSTGGPRSSSSPGRSRSL